MVVTEHGGEKVQIFFNGEILIEREFAWHIAYPAADLCVILYDVVTIYRGISHRRGSNSVVAF